MPFLILLLAGLLPGAAGATPEIQHWTTREGARVYFVAANELPIVDVQLSFAAGSAQDPVARHGLALLTSSLLDEGAGGRHADEIAHEFERLGAIYGAAADYDTTSVSLRSLSDADMLRVALANFERVLAKPDFPEDALERQRRRFLVALQQKQQSAAALAADAFAAAVYGDHPYGHPSEGDAESLGRITRQDVIEFHRSRYTAASAIIAIVGDLSTRKARSLAQELSRALPRGAAAPALPPAPPAAARLQRIAHPSQQVHILLGQPGMAVGDPDYFALYVGNHILGGGGLVSRLFDEIREQRGLSYSASSYFSPRRVAGPFTAGIQTRAEQAEEALGVLKDSIARYIESGPTAEELDAAKKNLTGGFPLRLDSNRKILNYVAFIGFHGLPLDYLETFNSKVAAVSAEQVQDAFRRRLDPERMVTIMVGPVAADADAGSGGD